MILLAIIAIVFYLVLLSTTPSGAQTGSSGLPAGTPATGENTNNPSSPPNLITIPAESCTVSPGASVTLRDNEGDTPAVFTDGQNGVEITATNNQVEIQGPGNGFIGNAASSFPDASDRSFSTNGNYTVVSSTGITCAGGGTAGGNQTNQNPTTNQNSLNPSWRPQGERSVINVPKKPLPPSGGLPVVATGASFVLTGMAFFGDRHPARLAKVR